MKVHIFLLCYNEEILLPHTIEHYKRFLPNCKITIYDNESTDKSVSIATALGCEIISWNSNNEINDIMYRDIKNTCWKDVPNGWIIVADMDEWLYITEAELSDETKKGTTILTTRGFNIVGYGKEPDLSDIDLHSLKEGIYHSAESKSLCFNKTQIQQMDFSCGGHQANPVGKNIKYSEKHYIIKHMIYLGSHFWVNKNIARYLRAESMRKIGLATHYTDNIEDLTTHYKNATKTLNKINLASITNEYLQSLPPF